MVPLVQKPVMQYSIEWLREHGITDIAVTVQYLPDVIKNYFGDGSKFGVSLTYFEETTPLGTAGSVKQAEDFLDEPFVVVSGDALTDLNLYEGISFHYQRGSLVTIFMKHVDDPTEFGLVRSNPIDTPRYKQGEVGLHQQAVMKWQKGESTEPEWLEHFSTYSELVLSLTYTNPSQQTSATEMLKLAWKLREFVKIDTENVRDFTMRE